MIKGKEGDKIILAIKKVLHRYDSGNRKDGGYKIVTNLNCDIRRLCSYNFWRVTLYWTVGYRQKDDTYLCRRTRILKWHFEDIPKQEKNAKRFFEMISNFIDTTDYPRSHEGDIIKPWKKKNNNGVVDVKN